MSSILTEKLRSMKSTSKPDLSQSNIQNDKSYDASILPFREWSDKEVHEENWSELGLPRRSIQRSNSGTERFLLRRDTLNEDDSRRFTDVQFVQLPPSIFVYEWKRPSQIFVNAELAVYVKNDEYPDLISHSKHVLHSEFMRSFISSIYTLTYLGNTTRFSPQFESHKFVPNTRGIPWKAWHHIYSNTSSSKRNQHNPTCNKIGKYIVRLFWLGTWRKIYVDDRLPVDMLNNILLPSVVTPRKGQSKPPDNVDAATQAPTSVHKQSVVELWPYLLAKALLKIASMTSHDEMEIVDFDIIQCLTGWVPQRIDTTGLPISDIWKICCAYADHYTWTPSDGSNLTPRLSEVRKSASTHTEKGFVLDQGSKEKEPIEEVGKVDEKEGQRQETDIEDLQKIDDEELIIHSVIACCKDLRNADDAIPNYSPCWGHEFLIDQIRDIPLTKTTLPQDLESWKRIRWLKWAAKNGIVSDELLLAENFHYKIVTAFRNFSDTIAYKQLSKISMDTLLKKMQKEELKAKTKKEAKKAQKGQKTEKAKKPENMEKPTEVNLVGADSDLAINKDISPIEGKHIDPSFWIHYEKLSQQINKIIIYFHPSKFKTKIKVTNLIQEGRWNVGKKSQWKVLEKPIELQNRNEPLYIFTESLDDTVLLVNLSQTGDTDILRCKKQSKKKVSIFAEFTECEFCLASLVKRVKANITNIMNKEYIAVDKPEANVVEYSRCPSHIVLEEYNWQSNKIGKTTGFLKTYGSKTTCFEFPPGRKIQKLWIKSKTPYVVHIFSNASVAIGDLENALFHMSQESMLLESLNEEISLQFLELIQAFGKPEFSRQLKEFYKSYKPEVSLTKKESNLLNEIFLDLLFELIEHSLTPEELYAMKILLYRWQNIPQLVYPEAVLLCNCFDDEDLSYLKTLERYVVRIQAYFKGIYERSLMRYHNQSHIYFEDIADALNYIYLEIFAASKRNSTCSNLIRALFSHPKLNQIREKYAVYHDLENVVHLKEVVVDNVKISESQWALICRQQFSVNSHDPTLIKINLFSNLDQYMVRVIDNDTNNEQKRYTNNVAVAEYRPNTNGYTVLCYAMSPDAKRVNCKLSFATKKEVQIDKIILPFISSDLSSFHGTYVPNVNNYICKYLIKVLSERILLSARFAVSKPDAIISFKICDDKGKLMKEIVGKGFVVLPAIILEYKEGSFFQSSSESISTTSSSLLLKKSKKSHGHTKTSKTKTSVQKSPEAIGNPDSAVMIQKVKSRHHSKESIKSHISHISRRESLFSVKSNVSSVSRVSQKRTSSRFGWRTSLKFADGKRSVSSYGSTASTVHGSATSVEPHIPPFYYAPNITPPVRKLVKITAPVEYRILVHVLDDSWPLNAEEWRNAQSPMPDGYISYMASTAKETPGQGSKGSLKNKKSNLTIRYLKKSGTSLTKLSRSNMSLDKQLSSNSVKRHQRIIDKPYWIMDIVIDHGEVVDFTKNTKREAEQKEVKAKWSERDPGRAKFGHELRRQFLLENLRINTNRPLEEDPEDRSLEKEKFAVNALPPLDFKIYMRKDPNCINEDGRRYKNNLALERDQKAEKAIAEEAENRLYQNQEVFSRIARHQEINLKIMNDWFNGVLQDSQKMMKGLTNYRSKPVVRCRTRWSEDYVSTGNSDGYSKKDDKKRERGKKRTYSRHF